MAKNYVSEGDVLDYTNTGALIPSGAVVVMGKRIGVALADIPTNSTGSVSMTGVWTLPRLTTDDTTQGEVLYWDAANNRVTEAAGALPVAGYAAAAAGVNATTVRVKINA
jgi:predicted RecA/RadA family phage recombinase